MPPVFTEGQIRVFDKRGIAIGVLTKWSVEQPRSYRFNEIEDFTFSIPRNDETTGEVFLTSTVCNVLLRRDNHIYIQNQDASMRGWAGQITRVRYVGGKAVVVVAGLAQNWYKLETNRIEQNNGFVWTIAQRLVGAAQSKQAAAGDFIIEFEHDETPGAERRNYGLFSYEGDIFAGLQQLATGSLSEFFVHAIVGLDGNLHAKLRWGGRWHIDHRDIVLTDGPDGNIKPGCEIEFASSDLVNHVRLRGSPTTLADFVDYDSIRSVIKDVTPEAELDLDPGTHRTREELGLTVGFGFDETTQRVMAAEVQDLYLGLYKSFVYAFHNLYGRPFLEGYDWPGPDGRNDKKLTAHYFRSFKSLGYIGAKTVITATTTDDDSSFIEAQFDDWQFEVTLYPALTAVGIAIDYSDPNQKFIADGATGDIIEMDADRVTTRVLLHATTGSETLVGVATDPTQPSTVWVAVTLGSNTIIKAFNASSGVMLYEWSVPILNGNDIAVDASNGIVWLVAFSDTDIHALDINSGTELLTGTYRTFPVGSGFSDLSGISISGGLAYVGNVTGSIRFLFTADGGDFAGHLDTGVNVLGLLTDVDGGEVWVVRADGHINIYRAHIAVAVVNAAGSVEGAPGFDNIVAGQFVHVVMDSAQAAVPHPRDQWAIAYSPGRYVTRVVPTTPGEPDSLQRQWVTGDAVFAIVKKSKVHLIGNELIIQGEESRVDDWHPKDDGYGVFGTEVLKTANGHILRTSGRWRLQDWDIPPRTFEIDPPEWTEGLAYLAQYLAIRNQERAIQVVNVINAENLFRDLVLGGEYTVQKTLDGPPGGLTGVLRLLAYTPDELQGSAELIGEWVE